MSEVHCSITRHEQQRSLRHSIYFQLILLSIGPILDKPRAIIERFPPVCKAATALSDANLTLQPTMASVRPLRVAFIHPDLGIGEVQHSVMLLRLLAEPVALLLLAGGAERLIVDAATGLKDLGHEVAIYTSHWDPQRCFKETRDGAPVFVELV